MAWTGVEQLAVADLAWTSSGRSWGSLIAKATFSLEGDVARLSAPEPIVERDRVPFKAGVDVTVHGWARTGASRRLVGVAIAHAGAVQWGKRLVRSWVDGEATWTGLDEEAVASWGPVDVPGVEGDVEDGAAFQCAPVDQRLDELVGGEQVLLMGWGWTDRVVTLPSVAARASAGEQLFGMAIDHLHLDLERGVAALTWRGLVPSSVRNGHVALLPRLDGPWPAWPPMWKRTPWRPRDPRAPVVVNPSSLGVAPLPPGHVPNGCVAKLAWSMPPGGEAARLEPQPPLEGEQYVDDDPEQALLRPGDLAWTKPEVDVLALGHVYPEAGEGAGAARLCLGSVDKRVLAVGERRWKDGRPSDPAPFERLAMNHCHAFGGPEYEANPAGTGRGGTPPPRLEDPNRLVQGPEDDAPPACLSPISPMWKARDGGGTFDEAWQRDRCPELPDDFDPRAWQAAPPDQRCASLNGDESFVVEGMRPEREVWKGTLPPERPWIFAPDSNGEIHVAQARLDTVLLEPETATVTVQWRAPLSRPVTGFAVLVGNLTEPPPLPRAWGLLAGEPDHRFDHAEHEPFDRKAWEKRLKDAAREHRMLLRPAPPVPPTPSPPSRQQIEAWAEDDALAGKDMAGADLSEMALSGKDLSGAILSGAVLTAAVLEGAKLSGANLADADATGASFVDADLTGADLTGAQLNEARFTRADLSKATFAEASLHRADFRRATARRLEAPEASFRHAYMDEVNLFEADLTGAHLHHAMMARADLTAATLERVEAHALVLDEATLDRARFSGATLTELSAVKVSAKGSIWMKAAVIDSNLNDADLSGAMLDGALANGTTFRHADLKRARFRGASLQKTRFDSADLMHADLAETDQEGASFEGANVFPK